MLRRRASLVLVINTVGIFAYEAGRRLEIVKLEEEATVFAETGMIFLESPVSSKQKIDVWNSIVKPHMIDTWIKTIIDYDISKDLLSQIDQPSHGKTYNLGSSKKLDHLPKLCTDNYRVQLIVGYMIDPSLKSVDFGNQTHWKYRFIRDPFYKFFYDTITNNKSKAPLILEGSDQSWHITVIKNKHGEANKPVPWATHIDGGEDGVMMRNGWPPVKDSSLTTDEELLLILLHQLAILFYCETPGDLGIEEGVTGFFPSSHRAVINVFRKLLNDQKGENIPHSKITTVLRYFGKENANDIEQFVIPENKVLLAFGTMVHTPMWATKLMVNDELRVIQNCKIKFSSDVRKANIQKQREIINLIPNKSLLYKLE